MEMRTTESDTDLAVPNKPSCIGYWKKGHAPNGDGDGDGDRDGDGAGKVCALYGPRHVGQSIGDGDGDGDGDGGGGSGANSFILGACILQARDHYSEH